MKKLIVMSVLLISCFSYQAADAQVSVNLNVNLGSQPKWGPSGYSHVDYYFLPDINAYYHVPTRKYTYMNGRRWVTSSSLPRQYRNYDLYKGRKVVMNQQQPWLRQASSRTVYVKNNNRNVYKKNVQAYNKDKGRGQDDRNSRDDRNRVRR